MMNIFYKCYGLIYTEPSFANHDDAIGIDFRITAPLWRESLDYRYILSQSASDAEL